MRWVKMAVIFLAACSLAPRVLLAADRTKEVPFKLYRGYAIVVRGSIGNLRNLNFLIDTGAVPSVLDLRIAQKLHLNGPVEKLSVFTHKLEAERVRVPDVNMGPFHSDELPAVTQDLSFASDALGSRVDAIIGFDFLNQSAFTIDYQLRKIAFGPIDPSFTVIPYEAYSGYAVVEMKIQRRTLRLLLDTGASDLVLFASAMRESLDGVRIIGTRTWSNMVGEIQVQQVRLADAHLGAMPWSTRDVFILPDRGENRPYGMGGLLGMVALKARRVAFDPEHRTVAWEAGSEPGAPHRGGAVTSCRACAETRVHPCGT